MTWPAFGLWLAAHAKALAGSIGLGSGIGLVKFLKHCPAPYQDQPWAGALFDTAQDLVSNSRIGERRTRAGAIVPAVAEARQVPQPVAAVAAPTGPAADPTAAGRQNPPV